MKIVRVLVGFVTLIFTLAIPRILNYQGKLTDSAGVAIEGTYTITFSLYSSEIGGSPLWSETQSVVVSNGIFSTILGIVNPIPDSIDFTSQYWLEITVNDEILTPRERLTSVPYAFSSFQSVNTINAIQAINSSASYLRRRGIMTFTADSGITLSDTGDSIVIRFTGAGGTSGPTPGLSQVLAVDNSAHGFQINMNNNRIVLVGRPIDSTDAATKGYVDSRDGAGLLFTDQFNVRVDSLTIYIDSDILKLKPGGITSEHIANGTIRSEDIGTGEILASNIATGAVGSEQIANGSIQGIDIAEGTITAANIAESTITANLLAPATITTDRIAPDAITSDRIANSSVRGEDLYWDDITPMLGDTLFFSGGITIKYPCGEAIALRDAVYLPGSLSGWLYRQPITINNSTAFPQTQYQVKITLTSTNTNFWNNVYSPTGADVRFTDTDGSTILRHWKRSYNSGTRTAEFWVRVPSIPAAGNKIIYLYYHNPSASDVSNFSETFTKDYGESGLVALYHMDEASGEIVSDGSGNGNHGTFVNSPSWQTADGGQWDGESAVNFSTGSCLGFNGSNYVNVPHSATLSLSSAITIEGWLKGSGSLTPTDAFADELDNASNISEQSRVEFTSGLVKIVGSGQPNWYDANWVYRRPVTINNASGSALTDYQVLITFDSQGLISAGKMRSDCGDLRFTSSDGTTSLNYWIESGVNTSATRVWVKVPNLPTGTTTIYMYYGNPSATSTSNGSATFVFFDDFEGSSLSSIWTANANSYSVSGSLLRINVGAVRLTNPLSYYLNSGYVLESRVIYYNITSTYSGTITACSSQYTQGGNAGADATILYMREVNSTNIHAWIGSGTSASYNIFYGYLTPSSDNTFYVLTEKIHPGGVILQKDYTTVYSANFTWSKNLRYITIGMFDGTSGSDIHDTGYDWVRVRRYSSSEPATTVELEQVRLRSSGYIVSNAITPSAWGGWGIFDVTDSIPSGTSIIYDILDGTTGNPIPGYMNLTGDTDLSGLTATSIKLKATLYSNADSTVSPALKSWRVGWTNLATIGKGGAYGLGVYAGDTLAAYINGKLVRTGGWSSTNWNHIAMTFDGANLKLYRNGTLANTSSVSGAINLNNVSLNLGRNFSGIADEVRIYNRVLTEHEIHSHYERRKYLPEDPTISFGAQESGSSSGLRKASATSEYASEHFLGFSLGSCSGSADSTPVRISGVVLGFSGLSVGAEYYLSDTPGEISTNTGTNPRRVGIAISPEKLLIAR